MLLTNCFKDNFQFWSRRHLLIIALKVFSWAVLPVKTCWGNPACYRHHFWSREKSDTGRQNVYFVICVLAHVYNRNKKGAHSWKHCSKAQLDGKNWNYLSKMSDNYKNAHRKFMEAKDSLQTACFVWSKVQTKKNSIYKDTKQRKSANTYI